MANIWFKHHARKSKIITKKLTWIKTEEEFYYIREENIPDALQGARRGGWDPTHIRSMDHRSGKESTSGFWWPEECLHSWYSSGDGPPTVADVQDAPWWHYYYWTQTRAGCVECGTEMVEDRALSIKCHHQACTSCALSKTVIPCPMCTVKTNYFKFNGQQCPDEKLFLK